MKVHDLVNEDLEEGWKSKAAAAALAAANLLGSPAQAAEEPAKPITIAYVMIDGEIRKYNLGDKFSNSKEAEKFISGILDKQGLQGYTLDIKHGYPKKKDEVKEAPIEMDPSAPNNPNIYGHEKANPMSLKGRIMSARAQLKELASMADSDELVVWEKITRLSKGGMFMGLEQNFEQIRHGIDELAKKRKKGGTGSRGIDRGIGETATAGGTSAGSIATVANPPAARQKIKRDKNGLPVAPQLKNADGTAKNALNVNNSLLGGKTIKR